MNEDTRVLKLIFDGQVAHRETVLKTIVQMTRRINAISNDLALKTRVELQTDHKRLNFDELEELVTLTDSVRKLFVSMREADTTIGNIENLSRGRIKYFGTPVLPKGPSNVTQLPRASSITPSRGPSSTRTNQRTDNPGRERQRIRKQPSNNE